MPLKRMKECQCSYTDKQLNFWLLLQPLTDVGEASSWYLVWWPLSVWHWALALDALTYLPTPSSLNIGHWLCEYCKISETQKWIQTYVCTLHCIDEASVGNSWTLEDKSMNTKISNLVEMFTAVTGMCVPSCMMRECWHSPQESIPQQDLQGVQGMIVRRLDEVVMHQPSLTMWDSFMFPQVKEEHWKEECLSYYLGKVVNIGVHMLGIRLVVQNAKGQ